MFVAQHQDQTIDYRSAIPVAPENYYNLPHPCPNESCSECIQQYRTPEEQRWLNHSYCQALLTVGDIWPSKEVNENVIASREACDRYVQSRGPNASRDVDIAKGLANTVLRHHEYLKRICTIHGDTIIERWKGYKVNKRVKVLMEADPHFSTEEWLHIKLYEAEDSEDPDRINYRNETAWNHFFFEYINIEAFKEDGARLLNLLFNRAQYHPEEFVIYDSCQLKQGWQAGQVDLLYNPGCLVMHGAKYGELVHWEQDAAHRWDIIGFPRAKLILQAQMALLSLLCKIVDKILHDVDKSLPVGPIPAQFYRIRSLEFRESNNSGFSSSYYNEPYSAPLKFDMNKIFNIAKTQLGIKKDHLWLLQTDLAYAKYWLDILRDGDLIRDKSLGWNHESVLVMNLHAELQEIQLWTEVVQETTKVKELHDSLRGQIKRGQDLPLKYNRALGALEVLLVDYMTKFSSYFSFAITQRPGFREYNKWNFVVVKGVRKRVPKLEVDHEQDPLFYYLHHLLGKADNSRKLSRAMLFRRLEKHLRNESKEERGRIDQVLSKMLSDWAAFHEILRMVRYHSPRHEKRVLREVEEWEKGDSWLYTKKNSFQSAPETDDWGPKIAQLVERFSKLPRPSGKRDEHWIESDKASRKALSDFWEGIRAYQKIQLRYLGMSEENMVIEMRTLSADMNPEHIANINANYDQIRTKIEEQRQAKANKSSKASTKIQTTWGDESVKEPKDLIGKTNTKTKTRPEGIAPNSDNDMVDTSQDVVVVENTEEVFAIPKLRIEISKKKVFALFTSIFRDMAVDQDMRNVPWEEFRHSMIDIGFDCTNGGGSAVMFTAGSRLGWAEGRKISFHKPHPETHIAPVILQVWRKRLTKHFGFEKGSFVYKKLENAENHDNLVAQS